MRGKADRGGGEGQDISMRRVSAAICRQTNEKGISLDLRQSVGVLHHPHLLVCRVLYYETRHSLRSIGRFRVHDSLKHHHVVINGDLIQNRSDYSV